MQTLQKAYEDAGQRAAVAVHQKNIPSYNGEYMWFTLARRREGSPEDKALARQYFHGAYLSKRTELETPGS